jgi:hypothetical protein
MAIISRNKQKLMLRACPRCQGDLLFDSYEEDFACLQCGRHFGAAALLAVRPVAVDESKEETPALAA